MTRSLLNHSFVPRWRWALIVLVLATSTWTLRSLGATSEWRQFGSDLANSQYSPLKQIHRGNVEQLTKAWEYKSAKTSTKRSQIQCNPLIADGTLYGTSPALKVFALDAASGTEKWTFDPFGDGNSIGVNRGVVYWSRENQSRILFTASHWLYALNTATGQPISEFGDNGRVDLRQGLERDPEKLFILSNTPGSIYQNLLILGTRVGEGPGPSAPGYIRAYDVETGEMKWVFHTIPHPGEEGHDTWPKDAWKTAGGANAWSGLAIDEARGWVFCPTGSPSFDFWGGNRIGQNLYGNSLLVLNATTGEKIWHYQIVHHDLWDRDLPASPNLVELTINKEKVPAVAQITKSGHVFLFHRETGEPIFPIEERPFPPSDLMNEQVWPTQPIPTAPPPFARQAFEPKDVSRLSPETHDQMLEKLLSVRSGGQFVPPSEVGTVIFPGFDGGGEWGGAAWDPENEYLYVNANEMPWILTMVEVRNKNKSSAPTDGAFLYQRLCAICHGMDRVGDPQKTYPPLVDIKQKMNTQQIIDQMSQGKGLMPAFGFLTLPEKTAIAQYLLGETGSSAPARTETKEINQKKDNEREPYSHTGYNRFLDPDGYPAIKPPWGTLNAIDLKAGRIAWQVTLGEFADLKARGLSPTGTENYGGPAVTAGGLVFIGASKDESFRAFDKSTGELLWETKLPAGGYATPSVYEANGRQYVVIACGGGKMNTKSGVTYVAFALPQS